MKKLELKTVKELSNDLKVTKQTIYNKIREIKNEVSNDEQANYFQQVGKTLNITPQGIEFITKKLGIEQEQQLEVNPTDDLLLAETIKTLQEQLKIKDEQLKIKDSQILKLTETIQQQQESITTQLKTDREQGYIKALETQIQALEAQNKQIEINNQYVNVFKRIWLAIKNENF